MAIIIIPTKIVPGCVLGAGLAGASMFTGLTSGVLFYAPQKIKLLHFLCYPIFVGILILIKKAWSTPKSRDKIVELNPKIFAVIAAICVIVGVATGVAVSSLMK